MRIAIYAKTSRPAVLGNIAKGVEAMGLAPVWRNPWAFTKDQTEPFDVVVIPGLIAQCKDILEAYKAKGVPVLVQDAGYIRRDLGYFQLGWNRLNWMPDAGDHARAKAIGAVAKSRRKKGKYVLVCGQKPGDAQHDIQDMDEWARLTVKIIEDASDLPVVYRSHPRVMAPECSIAEALEDAAVMVTHNSTSAYQAFVDGVPVVCTDEDAVYAGCAQNFDDVFVKGKNIVQRTVKTRQAMLDRIAAAQWTREELETGKPTTYMIEWGKDHGLFD